jgi:hypothetical protein
MDMDMSWDLYDGNIWEFMGVYGEFMGVYCIFGEFMGVYDDFYGDFIG